MDKYYYLFKMCRKWISNLQNDIRINDKLVNAGVRKIAVYGWGEVAWSLVRELEGIKIEYIIDRNASGIHTNYPVYLLSDELPDVDLVIVTIIDQYELIESQLREVLKTKVCSLDEIVCEDLWSI